MTCLRVDEVHNGVTVMSAAVCFVVPRQGADDLQHAHQPGGNQAAHCDLSLFEL